MENLKMKIPEVMFAAGISIMILLFGMNIYTNHETKQENATVVKKFTDKNGGNTEHKIIVQNDKTKRKQVLDDTSDNNELYNVGDKVKVNYLKGDPTEIKGKQ